MVDVKTRKRLLNTEDENQRETGKKMREKGRVKKKRKRDKLVVLMILLVSILVSLGFYLFTRFC